MLNGTLALFEAVKPPLMTTKVRRSVSTKYLCPGKIDINYAELNNYKMTNIMSGDGWEDPFMLATSVNLHKFIRKSVFLLSKPVFK